MKRKQPSSSKRPVSAGILLYKRDVDGSQPASELRYLLGLVPQRNFWTVFKGMPDKDESLEETALREFEEETGTTNVLKSVNPETTLRGTTAKKDLVVFLQEGSFMTEDCFDIEKVVKIDQGYMEGQPEIIAIRWMTLTQAVEGTDGAKIYPSQKSILENAELYLVENEPNPSDKKVDSKGD